MHHKYKDRGQGLSIRVEHPTYMDLTRKVSGLSIVDIIYGARINDESISDPHIYDAAEILSPTDRQTNQRTNKAILGVGYCKILQNITC